VLVVGQAVGVHGVDHRVLELALSDILVHLPEFFEIRRVLGFGLGLAAVDETLQLQDELGRAIADFRLVIGLQCEQRPLEVPFTGIQREVGHRSDFGSSFRGALYGFYSGLGERG